MSKRTTETVEIEAVRTIADPAKIIHLVSTSKGGVGKSLIAVILDEYLKTNGVPVVAYDADHSNATLSKFKAVGARRVKVIRDGQVDPAGFDEMVGEILSSEAAAVIDTGSDAFHAIWNYLTCQDLMSFFAENGRSLIVHAPIAPEPDLEYTVRAFEDMADQMQSASIVPWLNERTERIDVGSDLLARALREHEEKILGIVKIANRQEKLHRRDVQDMLISRETFGERLAGPTIVMVKQRLFQVRREIYGQLQEIGL